MESIKMKNLLVIAIIIISSSISFAQKTANEYVTNEEGTVFFTNVKYSIFNFIVGELENGEKIKYKKNDILEYKKDGQVYTKLPEIVNNKETDKNVFMKLLSYKCGLKVYQYSKFDSNGNEFSEILIYDNKTFVVDINNDKYKNLTVFFNESYYMEKLRIQQVFLKNLLMYILLDKVRGLLLTKMVITD